MSLKDLFWTEALRTVWAWAFAYQQLTSVLAFLGLVPSRMIHHILYDKTPSVCPESLPHKHPVDETTSLPRWRHVNGSLGRQGARHSISEDKCTNTARVYKWGSALVKHRHCSTVKRGHATDACWNPPCLTHRLGSMVFAMLNILAPWHRVEQHNPVVVSKHASFMR